MAKVKMLISISGAVDGNWNVRAGHVIDVSDGTAFDLCANKYAEPVEEPKPVRKKATKKATAKVETASVKAPEAAMRPQAEPRDG